MIAPTGNSRVSAVTLGTAVVFCLLTRPAVAQMSQSEAAKMMQELAGAAVARQSADPVLARSSTLFLQGLLGEQARAVAEARHETARTDKQIGASARAGGTTTVAERAGFATLLGFALERGALQEQQSGSTYTLSTTPYAAVALVRGDTGTTYNRWGELQRLGLAASFKLTGGDPLASVNKDNFVEASVRFRVTGDRTARSRDFDQFWARTVRPAITARLVASRTGPLDLLTERGAVQKRFEEFRSSLAARVADGLKQGKDASAITQIIEAEVNQLAAEVANNTLVLEEDARATLRLLPDEIAAANAAVREAMESAEYQLLAAKQAAMVTGVYSLQKGAMPSNSEYSVLKILFEQKSGSRGSIIANAAFSFYHEPDAARNQQRVRDFAFAFSFEGGQRVRTALTRFDASAMTVSLSLRYQHLRENKGVSGKKADIGVVQGKVELPFGAGLALPLSVSWATASELIDEGHVTGHIGFSLDSDKLAAIAKVLLPAR